MFDEELKLKRCAGVDTNMRKVEHTKLPFMPLHEAYPEHYQTPEDYYSKDDPWKHARKEDPPSPKANPDNKQADKDKKKARIQELKAELDQLTAGDDS